MRGKKKRPARENKSDSKITRKNDKHLRVSQAGGKGKNRYVHTNKASTHHTHKHIHTQTFPPPHTHTGTHTETDTDAHANHNTYFAIKKNIYKKIEPSSSLSWFLLGFFTGASFSLLEASPSVLGEAREGTAEKRKPMEIRQKLEEVPGGVE